MKEVDAEEPRKVPYHIDRDGRVGDAVVVFIFTLLVSNLVRTVFGGQVAGKVAAFSFSALAGICFYRFILRKPKGYLLHRVHAITGIPVKGLISPKIKRFRR